MPYPVRRVDDAHTSRPVETCNPTIPNVFSITDLTIVKAWDPDTNSSKYITFRVITPDEAVFFGESPKQKRDMTLEGYNSALNRIADNETYPEVPQNVQLKLALESLDDNLAYVKRPGLNCYETMEDTGFVPNALLDETLIMKLVSKFSHEKNVRCYGCRVRSPPLSWNALVRPWCSVPQPHTSSNSTKTRFSRRSSRRSTTCTRWD